MAAGHRAPPFHRIADSSSPLSPIKGEPEPLSLRTSPSLLHPSSHSRPTRSAVVARAKAECRPSLDSLATSLLEQAATTASSATTSRAPPPLSTPEHRWPCERSRCSRPCACKNRDGRHLQIQPLQFVPIFGEHTYALPLISSLYFASHPNSWLPRTLGFLAGQELCSLAAMAFRNRVIWIGTITIFQSWRYTTTIHLF
jgi:hypothetical protein